MYQKILGTADPVFINGDNTHADVCLTRITDKHHTYRLEMNGINMRETE